MSSRADVHVRNAAAMWRAFAPESHDEGAWTRVELPGTTRIILSRPTPVARFAGLSPAKTVRVEDAYAGAAVEPFSPAAEIRRMPIMVRPAGGTAAPAAAAPVIEVRDEDALADAERVMIDGFPLPQYQPWVRAGALPPRVLAIPGWRVWLARHDGDPAAAVYTYDDGASSGVYWLATLPGHRSRGLGRAVLAAAMAARPDHEFSLVATEAGRPLYESLGFAAVATTTWHLRRPLAAH